MGMGMGIREVAMFTSSRTPWMPVKCNPSPAWPRLAGWPLPIFDEAATRNGEMYRPSHGDIGR